MRHRRGLESRLSLDRDPLKLKENAHFRPSDLNFSACGARAEAMNGRENGLFLFSNLGGPGP